VSATAWHAPSSLAAVIGLSNNDVISLRSLHCVRCVGCATGVVHMSNGMTDIDGNQLTTPQLSVNETGYYLWLYLSVPWPAKSALRLDIYIVNEMSHRIRDRLYSRYMDTFRSHWVGCS